jgi:hypothetical protein
MRSPAHTPSIVPDFDVAVYIVLDDFGKSGRVYREVGEEEARLPTVVDDLLTGQYNNPVRVIAFNTAEGLARDVSEDVAWEVLGSAAKQQKRLPNGTRGFVEFHVGDDETLRAEAGLI